ncbi:hypothetical protein [Enterococcus sp. DIV2371]
MRPHKVDKIKNVGLSLDWLSSEWSSSNQPNELQGMLDVLK